MKTFLLVLLVVAWASSLFLMVRLLRSDRGLIEKVAGCALLLVPVFGPFLYQFVLDPPPANRPHLQARGPRGESTHTWIAIRPVLEEGLKDREASRDDPGTGQDGSDPRSS